jgi:type I restriction enzyme S subunit
VSGLPKGWVEARIGAVADLRLGKMLDQAKNQGKPTPYLRNINVRWGAFDLSDIAEMRMTDSDRQKYSIRNGDVMVCEGGEPGRAAVWRGDRNAFGFQKALIRLRAREGISPEWFVHFLKHASNTGTLSEHFTGTTIKHLPQIALFSTRLPLPPLPEQRRIVAKLDSLTGRTARAREELGRIQRLIQRYREAILSSAFDGVFVGLPSTDQVPLLTYVRSLDQGWSPKCESSGSDDPNDWAVIKTTAIQPIHFTASENKRLPSMLQPRPSIQIQAGDVLITRAGPRSRVGISCVVTTARPRLMLCDKAYRIRVKDGEVDPTFLAMMLNSPQALRKIEEMKTGISDSGLNLTQEKFLGLSVPKLDLEQQQTTVRRIETAFSWLDRVTAEHANASRLLPKLDQAILAKAFRGELVCASSTTDRSVNG